MPAEANFGGALADITVTTSYRDTSLELSCYCGGSPKIQRGRRERERQEEKERAVERERSWVKRDGGVQVADGEDGASEGIGGSGGAGGAGGTTPRRKIELPANIRGWRRQQKFSNVIYNSEVNLTVKHYKSDVKLSLEEWPKNAPFFFSATLLLVLNPSFLGGV